MSDSIKFAFDEATTLAHQALDHLRREYTKLRAGKASPDMLSGILVDYYGSASPIEQVANVSASDSRTLLIQAWDKTAIGAIEKAIFEANLGLTPQNDGEVIRINIPPLTQERRQDLVKKAKSVAEEAKVSMRNIRRDIMDVIKEEVKDGYPEDQGKRDEEKVKSFLEGNYKKIDELLEAKEKDIMTL